MQQLDLCAQLCEAGRKSAARKLSAKEIELKKEQKELRAAARAETVARMEKLKDEAVTSP